METKPAMSPEVDWRPTDWIPNLSMRRLVSSWISWVVLGLGLGSGWVRVRVRVRG